VLIMKKLQTEKQFIPVTSEKIEGFCKKFGLDMPDGYKSFLLKYNGGRFKECLVKLIEPINNPNDNIAVVSFLYGFVDKMPSPYDMYDLYKEHRAFNDRVPKEFIVIGEDPGGNQICLCVEGNNYGKVYFWDHEEEVDEGKKPTYDNVYLISNSFIDFINSLYEDKA
jgi:hypothetical protein